MSIYNFDKVNRVIRCQCLSINPLIFFPVKKPYSRVIFIMSTKTIIRQKPLEMIVSQKRVPIEECMEMVFDIATQKLHLTCIKSQNVLSFQQNSFEICSLGWTEYGIIVLKRQVCPDFITIMRLCIVTMDELSSGVDNNLDLLEIVFGEPLFKNKNSHVMEESEETEEQDDEDEIIPLDREFHDTSETRYSPTSSSKLSKEALKSKNDTTIDDDDDDSDDFEWL